MKCSIISSLIAAFVCCSPTSVEGQNRDSKFAIVIHGGAGRPPSTQAGRKGREKVLKKVLQLGVQMLDSGASSLDTVEAVVRRLEDSEYFNAGKGAVLNAAGTHELDATIMDGRDRSAGAVGGVTTVRNPISLARRVMTDTRHVLLVADGAEQFADNYAADPQIERVSNSYFTTDSRRRQLERIQQEEKQSESDCMGTVGCVALDRNGNIAAATSTGGLTNKKFGRIGDSPIAGAGTFADNESCGVSCTGIGEDFIRNAVAYDVSARMRYQQVSLQTAVNSILTNEQYQVRGGIIAISRTGQIVMEFNTEGMSRAAANSEGLFQVRVVK